MNTRLYEKFARVAVSSVSQFGEPASFEDLPPTPFLTLASSIFLIFNDSFPTHSFQLRPHPFLYLVRIGQGLPQSTEGRRDEKPVWGGESTSRQQYEGKGQWTEDREPLGQEA